MIDFERIVEKLLLEAEPAPQSNSAQTEEEEAKTVYEFFESKYSDLQNVFNEVYKSRVYDANFSVFPDAIAFKNLVYNASKNSIRDTKKPGVFPDFMYIFPLLDIISQVKAIYVESKKGGKPSDIAETALKNFIEKLKKYKNTLPMDYNADDAWATTVKEAFISLNTKKLDVGSIKLAALSNYSLHYTIFKLLEQRKLSFAGKIEIDKLPKTNEVVEKVLFEPDVYTKAEQVFPDLKLKSFYYGVTPDLLLAVAKSVKNLFEQQTREKLNDEDYAKIEKNAGLKKQALVEFYKDQIDWKKYSTEQTTQETPSANTQQPIQSAQSTLYTSFDHSFELLHKQMLSEERFSVLTSAQADLDAAAEETNTSKNQTDAKIIQTFIDDKYTVGEVIKYANQKITTAKEVNDSLSQLADYIRTEVQKNTAEKVTSVINAGSAIAQAARLGTQKVGTGVF
jgi:hypothetical protein